MARTRETTSVSTLVVKIGYLNDLARVANRKDLTNGLSDLTIRTNTLVKEYEALKAEIKDFESAMLNPVEEKEKETVGAE